MIAIYASHLAAAGHRVTIKSNLVDTVFALHEDVRLEPLRFSGKMGTLLSALLERVEADLVVADIIPLVCLLWFHNRRRTVYFAQDYDESYYANPLQKLFIRFLYLLGLALFRVRTIAVSKGLADLLRRRFGAEVSVVENGVDTEIFYHDPDSELLAQKQGRKALLLLSRSDQRKGFDIALQVVEQVRGRLSPSLEIWTVGETAQGLFPGLLHRDFGYVGEERLRRILSSADLFLYPSRHEGFPLMPLEALACRCPIVTTAAVPYAVHGDNALVSRIEDAASLALQVEQLAHDRADRLVAGGERLAATHTLKDAQVQFERVLAACGTTG
jgi:glycosyltransferase involved in cell wall biosynthesis